ncbi:MAG: DUF6442 family protein [Eubacteriales bacterium]|jgi:hypothetical protein|nr:DUF6442 family protein [Eubacteriales bacterium]
MKKEEILEKSRKENKNQDVFEKEVSRIGGNSAAVAAAILATVFFVIQIFVGGGTNYGLYAVVFSIPATGYIIKAIYMKRKSHIRLAAIYIFVTLLFSIIHIRYLITASNIL